jgi:hypothetical protein
VAGVETGLPCRHYVLPHRTTLVVVVVLYFHVNVKVKRMLVYQWSSFLEVPGKSRAQGDCFLLCVYCCWPRRSFEFLHAFVACSVYSSC